MLRTLRRLSALTLIPAALALPLAGTATATSTPPSGIGTGYPLSNYVGTPHPLLDVGTTCTRVTDTRSAKNSEDSGRVITLYLDPRCETPVAIIPPGDGWAWIAEVGAMSYTTSAA
ncbi:hypothetical protein GCM10010387_60190 [Streptomyces inusitatus]|uniref:SH3b domain-containing protein n=1 Tax=Streptomyces inusitatus TaxID=68221 RepID=A0A918QPW0_9ACTN|nr:hypothetical protein [Streptomyces inusitatus]GGZ58257.1 hypothetical protein GCM10010387_60190 [Streptomyces inusitatus]